MENVRQQSRFNLIYGTNSIFLIMIVSIILLSVMSWSGNFKILIFIPIIVVSYELIEMFGNNYSIFSKIIAYLGLELHLIMTKESDDSQIEVDTKSLKEVMKNEEDENIGELINRGTNVLKESGIDTARLDAELLLSHILGKNKLYLMMNRQEKVSSGKSSQYWILIKKRKNKMPVKYIINKCEFMGIDFYVEEGVLIPRPDTEILVEEVLKHIKSEDSKYVCDLCCGSGAIGISLAKLRQSIKVDVIDYYEVPKKVTLINIKNNDLENRMQFIKSDLLRESINKNKKYDILVSNPPYIEDDEVNKLMKDVKDYEPHTALKGGVDGLDFYKKIIFQSNQVLSGNGILAFEIGYNQGEAVKTLMEENKFKNVKIVKDLAGLDRVVIGVLKNI